MTIIEDSRQHPGKHEQKREDFVHNYAKVIRCKLPVGDYALPPKVSVDTKANMSEIAQNIGGSHDEHRRFINELKLAQEMGTKLYILVENEDGIEDLLGVAKWRNPRTAFSPGCIQGIRLAKAMLTIEERYGCTFLFCKPSEAAETIIDLLR